MLSEGAVFPRWPGILALLLACFVYWFALGSDHAATNGDELLYAQITRLTAATGEWLPLQSPVERHRNTKPPALFWQGIVSTDWAGHWDLWHLRYPNVIYTLAVAGMVFVLGRRLGGTPATGILASLIYLGFFGVYRYGRVFLTSAPETFWLFLPVFILSLRRPCANGLTWPLAAAFGLATGIALLYKTFALLLPAGALLAWWTLHQRSYRVRDWLFRDAPKIAAMGVIALAMFSLWYVLDPQRHLILADFIVDENLGKFDTHGRSYFLRIFWGESSVWRNVISYPLNAGLLAPAVIALFWVAFRDRRTGRPGEALLWIWIATVFVVFSIPDQRDERYLLPAMPAIAALCASYWPRLPRWALAISLLAVAVIATGMILGASLLTRDLGIGAVYPWHAWAFWGALAVFALAGIFRPALTRTFVLPSVLLLYLGYALFLLPFDGPLGEYGGAAREFARGRTIAAPVNHGSREEIFHFMLPGSRLQPYKEGKPQFTFEYLRDNNDAFIISRPLQDHSLDNAEGIRVIGTRLNLVDRFQQSETLDMLRGNVSPHLFKKDVLVEVLRRGS